MSGSIGRRLRGRLFREQPLWGLGAPVTVEGGEGHYRIEASSPRDATIAEGYLCAHSSMLPTDLRRRLWSGRLAEVRGRESLGPGVECPQLDLFTRILGFRWAAEQRYRSLGEDERALLDAYALGVNAWTDAGHWQQQRGWKELDSRPRLWGGADSLLLAGADALMAASGPHPLTAGEAAQAAGWGGQDQERVEALWDLLRGIPRTGERSLATPRRLQLEIHLASATSEASTASGIPSSLEDSLEQAGRPTVLPETILEGGDNHRYERPGERPARLHARRQDIEVREGRPWRHWVRRSARGGVVSDLLVGAEGETAPAGQGFVWSWEGEEGGQPEPAREPQPPAWTLPPISEDRLKKTRLLPMESGAW